jgi:zinc protease
VRTSAAIPAAAILAALAAGCGTGPAPPPETYQLPNRLTVILRPVPGARQTALVVLYKVGGHHDPQGASGLAHLIEHVYVTAAAGAAQARDIRAYTARYSGGWNAQTGDDYTVVGCVFPRERLLDELHDAAARMADLRVAQADLDREKPRIAAELANMYGGIPDLAARNLARQRVCPAPQGGLKGGIAEEVRAVTLRAVQDRVKRLYKPANAVLVLAGEFDPETTRSAITSNFGNLPPGEPVPAPPAPPAAALPATATVRIRTSQPDAATVLCFAFAAPAPDHLDSYAPTLVLAARLWQRAPSLAGGGVQMPVQFNPLDDPKVILLSAPLGRGESPEQAVARLEDFLTRTLSPQLTPADVATTQNAFAFLLGLADLPDRALAQNLYGVAFGLARRMQLGMDPAAVSQALQRVTADDLARAAKTVFAPERRAAIVVVPEP